MGLGCQFNMIRCLLPSPPSPFTTNPSPLHSSPSFKGKELEFGFAKLSLIAFSFDENEMLHRDSLRAHTCLSSSPLTLENDYSNLEVTVGKRSQKGLHNMINDAQPSEDVSIFIRSLKACSGSHFHLLMENIKVLENRISDSDLVKKDVLLQLGMLGALELFDTCLSRNLNNPTTISTMSDSLSTLTRDCQVKEKVTNDSGQNMITSKKKHERKTRHERRLQRASKKRTRDSEAATDIFSKPLATSVGKKKKATDKRLIIAKTEAEMSQGIKVVAKLERVKATLEKETGKAVSLSSWAEAAGIDEKLLQRDLHFGWYCRDELLKSGRSLVLYLARNYRGLGVAHEDLIQAGNIGILQGAERFDHTRGYQFSTYVQYWIRKAMSQLVSQHGRGIKVPVALSTAISRVQRARKALKRTLGKHPDDAQLAKFTGLSLSKINSADKCLRVVGSIEQKVGSCINVKFLECTPDTTMEMAEKIVLREYMKNDINKLLKDLNPKERRVIALRYGFEGHCMSLHEIGKIFNVSKEWIRRMEGRALTQLKDEDNLNNLRHYLEP